MRRRSVTTVSTAFSKPCSVRRPRAGVVVEEIRRDRLAKLCAKSFCALLTSSAYVFRALAASWPPHAETPTTASTRRRTGMTLRMLRAGYPLGTARGPGRYARLRVVPLAEE